MKNSQIDARPMMNNRWKVSPKGESGTSGTINGETWMIIYVQATSAAGAIKKAKEFAFESGDSGYSWINE